MLAQTTAKPHPEKWGLVFLAAPKTSIEITQTCFYSGARFISVARFISGNGHLRVFFHKVPGIKLQPRPSELPIVIALTRLWDKARSGGILTDFGSN